MIFLWRKVIHVTKFSKLNLNKIVVSAYVVELTSSSHDLLAYINYKFVKQMDKLGLISYNKEVTAKYEICIQAKQTRKHYIFHKEKEIHKFQNFYILIFVNLTTRGDNSYFIIFIDDFSRYTYAYLINIKPKPSKRSSAINLPKDKGNKIRHCDRGGKYFSLEVDTYCEEYGILHIKKLLLILHSKMDLIERKNMTHVHMVNAMILDAKLPFNLAAEALLTFCHVHNRITLGKYMYALQIPERKKTKFG